MINSGSATNWRIINKCSRAYFVRWRSKRKIAVTTFRIGPFRRQPGVQVHSINRNAISIYCRWFFFLSASFSSRFVFFILFVVRFVRFHSHFPHTQSMTCRRIQRIFFFDSTSVRQDSLVDMIQILFSALQFRFSFSPFLRTRVCVPLAVNGTNWLPSHACTLGAYEM